MRLILAFVLMLVPGLVAAHPGHLIEVAGHSHWVAGAAIGLAIAVGLWGRRKGVAGGKTTGAEAEAEAEQAEAEDGNEEEAAA